MNGQELKTLRKKAGLTQKELAEKLGTSVSVVSKWENGKHAISLAYEKLIKLLLS
ncbi:MAG: helix-turn-helix transcriptional regulator [Thermonemataceae bacterium]|nr:helix-turn-helix transcriptional regulator [Thermonemataceae bacterium]